MDHEDTRYILFKRRAKVHNTLVAEFICHEINQALKV